MTLGQSQVNVISIKKFAEACHTTPKTLRLYEKLGVFLPAYINPHNKYRYYTPDQRREFVKIKLLQNFHLPLREIKSQNIDVKKFVDARLEVIHDEIREKDREAKFLKDISSFLLDDNYFKKQLKTKYFGPYTLFCHKIEHARYDQITNYIVALWKEAEKLSLQCIPSEITFYIDRKYNPTNIRLEIALICKDKQGANILPINHYFRKYPKTKTLTHTYKGPPEYSLLIYQKIDEYLEKQKVQVKDFVFEKYKYGPLNSKSKYGYITEFAYPIS